MEFNSLSQMEKEMLRIIQYEAKERIESLVTQAVKETADKVAAELMVRYGEAISAHLISRGPQDPGVELRIVYRGIGK